MRISKNNLLWIFILHKWFINRNIDNYVFMPTSCQLQVLNWKGFYSTTVISPKRVDGLVRVELARRVRGRGSGLHVFHICGMHYSCRSGRCPLTSLCFTRPSLGLEEPFWVRVVKPIDYLFYQSVLLLNIHTYTLNLHWDVQNFVEFIKFKHVRKYLLKIK